MTQNQYTSCAYHPLKSRALFRLTRQRLGLSPEELAEAMCTTARTIYRWEDGTRAIPGPVAVLMVLWGSGKLPAELRP